MAAKRNRKKEPDLTELMAKISAEMLTTKREIDDLKTSYDALRKKMVSCMDKAQMTLFETDECKVTLSRSVSKRFDGKRFEAEHPVLYAKYKTLEKVSEQLRITEV